METNGNTKDNGIRTKNGLNVKGESKGLSKLQVRVFALNSMSIMMQICAGFQVEDPAVDQPEGDARTF